MELGQRPQITSDSVDQNNGPAKGSSRPPNSASTAVATDTHPTLKIKTEANDVPRQSEASSSSAVSIHDIHRFSDSDLTDMDDDVFNPDATGGNQSDMVEDGIIKGNNTFTDAAGGSRRCPSHRQTLLWKERTTSAGEDHHRRGSSLPAPAKPANFFTHSTLPRRATKRKEAKTGRKVDQPKIAAKDDLAERRTSTRLQGVAKKRYSIAEYSGEDGDDVTGGTTVRSSRSYSMATQNVMPKLETEGENIPEQDSWKAGWCKSDSSVNESPKNESAATKKTLLPAKDSIRARRVVKAVHKKSHSTTLIWTRRIDCPKGCGKTFGRAHDAHRHADQTMGCGGGQKAFVCSICDRNFTRQDALQRHQNKAEHSKRPGPHNRS